MTAIRASLVDAYVLRGAGASLRCLALRRGPGGRCPDSWETVHGHIEPDERPAEAAIRELREETGLHPVRVYNLSRVEAFYVHRVDEIALIPVFAIFVAEEGEVRLSPEHVESEWLTLDRARHRFSWPRERRALDDIEILLGSGGAGPVEDVLRVC